jgi:hypothetical protein
LGRNSALLDPGNFWRLIPWLVVFVLAIWLLAKNFAGKRRGKIS